MRVTIGYGLERVDYEVSEASLVAARRQPSAPAIADLGQAVHDALEVPVGFPALRKALTPDDHVVIMADDHLPHQGPQLIGSEPGRRPPGCAGALGLRHQDRCCHTADEPVADCGRHGSSDGPG